MKKFKKLFLGFLSIVFVLVLSACGKKLDEQGTVEALLDGMIKGKSNEVVVKYCSNPSVLISDETVDKFGLRNALLSRMTYKIADVKKYEEDTTVTVELTTIDMQSVIGYLRASLKEDEQYEKLTGDAKDNYYSQKQAEAVTSLKESEYFRTVSVELTVKKDGNNWKIVISNEFAYAITGMRY